MCIIMLFGFVFKNITKIERERDVIQESERDNKEVCPLFVIAFCSLWVCSCLLVDDGFMFCSLFVRCLFMMST